MRARYAALLNEFPLVIPAGIFIAATFLLLPVAGEYSLAIALLAAAKLTECW